MLYISVDSLELAVERVRLRGLAGGHSAPPSVIEVIYERSHQNLKRAVEVFSVVQVFTSLQATGAEDEELIHLEAIFNQGSLSFGDRASWPDWLDHIEL